MFKVVLNKIFRKSPLGYEIAPVHDNGILGAQNSDAVMLKFKVNKKLLRVL